jgi:hypothetical protein
LFFAILPLISPACFFRYAIFFRRRRCFSFFAACSPTPCRRRHFNIYFHSAMFRFSPFISPPQVCSCSRLMPPPRFRDMRAAAAAIRALLQRAGAAQRREACRCAASTFYALCHAWCAVAASACRREEYSAKRRACAPKMPLPMRAAEAAAASNAAAIAYASPAAASDTRRSDNTRQHRAAAAPCRCLRRRARRATVAAAVCLARQRYDVATKSLPRLYSSDTTTLIRLFSIIFAEPPLRRCLLFSPLRH